jgi:hypothetical protein
MSTASPHRVMTQHVVDALFNARDELLPKVSEHGKPQRVSEWLSSCDDKQEALIFRLLHLALNRDNPAALYAVADELAAHVGTDYADAYVAFNEG